MVRSGLEELVEVLVEHSHSQLEHWLLENNGEGDLQDTLVDRP